MASEQFVAPIWHRLNKSLLLDGKLPPTQHPATAYILQTAEGMFADEIHCIKKVVAVLCLETKHGPITLCTMNGIPTSSSAHLEEYSPERMREIAKRIPDTHPNKAGYLSALEQVKGPLDCLELGKLLGESGSAYCLKGFPFSSSGANGNGHHATSPSHLVCPSSRAGCAERTLIQWTPYAVTLQKQLGDVAQNGFTIRQIFFAPHSEDVQIVYSLAENPDAWETVKVPRAISSSLDTDGVRGTLITNFLPCHACSKEIGKNPWIEEVVTTGYSRHGDGATQEIDRADLLALQLLRRKGVLVTTTQPHLKTVFRK